MGSGDGKCAHVKQSDGDIFAGAGAGAEGTGGFVGDTVGGADDLSAADDSAAYVCVWLRNVMDIMSKSNVNVNRIGLFFKHENIISSLLDKMFYCCPKSIFVFNF